MVKRLREFGGVVGSGELIIFKNALFEETFQAPADIIPPFSPRLFKMVKIVSLFYFKI